MGGGQKKFLKDSTKNINQSINFVFGPRVCHSPPFVLLLIQYVNDYRDKKKIKAFLVFRLRVLPAETSHGSSFFQLLSFLKAHIEGEKNHYININYTFLPTMVVGNIQEPQNESLQYN